MDSEQPRKQLLARCVVCRGNIFSHEPHEVWEGGYYCLRHSVVYLRERARQYAAIQEQEPVSFE